MTYSYLVTNTGNVTLERSVGARRQRHPGQHRRRLHVTIAGIFGAGRDHDGARAPPRVLTQADFRLRAR